MEIKTIAVDARPFTSQLTGIGTLLRNILDAILRFRPDVRLVLFTPSDFHPSLERDYLNAGNVEVVRSRFISERLPKLLWFHIWLPFLVRRRGINELLVLLTQRPVLLPRRVRTTVYVHDVVNYEFADTMELKNRITNKLFFANAVKTADRIWCNSSYTLSKVLEYFPDTITKPSMVGCSANDVIFRDLELTEDARRSFLRGLGAEGRTILFVGTLEPRKNLSFLLSLMPELWKRGITLLVVGARGWKDSSVSSIVQDPSFPRKSTVFCGYLTMDELVMLYNSVDCYVSTSLNEGFGLPQLEAMCCGCPVISPDNSAMSEVVGGRGLLVQGWDRDVWVDAISGYLDAPHPSPDLSAFAWDRIINDYIKLLETDDIC